MGEFGVQRLRQFLDAALVQVKSVRSDQPENDCGPELDVVCLRSPLSGLLIEPLGR